MGFFDKLKQGMNKTKASFDEKISSIFNNFRKVDEEFLDELEEALIMYNTHNIILIFSNESKNEKSFILFKVV